MTAPDIRAQAAEVDEGWPLKAEAIHIAEHDPARVLRQVEVLREIAQRHEDNPNTGGHSFDAGYALALEEEVVQLLASAGIYPLETGDPS